MLTVNTSALDEEKLLSLEPEIRAAHERLFQGTGEGNDFTGWLRLPSLYDKEEFERIRGSARRIRSDSDVLLVIGIGGSYLGARAAIEFCKSSFYNLKKKNTPDIYFVGNNLSPGYMEEMIALIGDRDYSINVISKSGTTTEPAVAFRIFKKLIEQKYGKEMAKRRIYATTDASRGALKELSAAEGYETFTIPDDIGGRFSVLTAVGLLPIAVAGINIDELMAGAGEMAELCAEPGMDNPAWRYALARNALYREGKAIEILSCYDPDFMFMAEWWKQLYGESEGKDGKGLFPASVSFTADLHSMGQYIQDGARNLAETVVTIHKPTGSLTIEADEENADGLNFLAGKSLHEIGRQAFRGTYLAHLDGGVPNLLVELDAKDERSLGQMIYFFEIACGLSGYLLGVNPFDQPGVEAYKKNMFALLGKPGFEEIEKRLNERLQI